ncbi:T9SS type A sorting domain-containing protein [Hymenobacter weizhouensis]|uniref:T9SS type A sorting domain-containing protein n=1 Tax=Hymenobacter sp. YIM 151500-1 TaxID=2987689 RepID=UPI002225CF82|nr:T9SS type A sorting domain-containing protein [Hymenobacter sp. YIM 151500-1]UYZ62656.1 T9SS type A sorting domain-containing protein [Hymenobacter sp. YIM 151500-1]
MLGQTNCAGDVDNPELSTDPSLTTAATMRVPLSLVGGAVRLRMALASQSPANYRAGVVVKRSGGLLNLASLNVASTLLIRTYLGNQPQETRPVDPALTRLVLGSETAPVRLEFVATKPFTHVEVEAAAFAALGYELDVYYAYGIDANVITQATGYVSRFQQPTARHYSTSFAGSSGVTLCANTNVQYPTNAVDASLTNYATLASALDVNCPVTLQTQLEGRAPAGYQAGFVVGGGSLLDASVLPGLRLTTYLNGAVQETGTGTDLLDLRVLSEEKSVVSMATTKPFDRVEIQRSSALTLLNDLRVYFGFGLEPRVFRDERPRLSNFLDPAGNFQVNGALVCVNCSVTNPERAADQDVQSNYASIQTLVAVPGTTRLKLRLDGPGRAGNVAGAVLGLGTGLLDARLLASVRINTYTGAAQGSGTDGRVLVESASGADLLNLELLAAGRQEVSFLTTRDFDWAEIEISNGAAALDNTRVYYSFAEDRPTGFPAAITAPTPLPVRLVAFRGRAVAAGVELTWQTATETNSSFFVVERAASATAEFRAVGQVAAAGTSTGPRRYQLLDTDVGSQGSGTWFYRLRQVDADGQTQYSSVVPVRWTPALRPVAVYPNPATSATAVVRVAGLPAGSAHTLTLLDSQGRSLRQHLAERAELPVRGLPAGLYHVVVTDAAGRRVATQALVVAAP